MKFEKRATLPDINPAVEIQKCSVRRCTEHFHYLDDGGYHRFSMESFRASSKKPVIKYAKAHLITGFLFGFF